MKTTIASLLALLIPSGVIALPLGNPCDPGLLRTGVFCKGICSKDDDKDPPQFCEVWSWRIGYYGDFVQNRHMEIDRSEDNSSLRQTRLETHAASLALNFWDRFDVFGTAGTTHVTVSTPGRAFRPTAILDNQNVTIDTDTHFSWSFGLRGMLWECGPLGFGAEVQYAHARPHLNSFTVEGLDPFYYTTSTHLDYHEWQMGIGVAYRIPIAGCSTALVPYVGLKWAHAKMQANTPQTPVTPLTTYTLFDLESERDFGFAIGITLIGCSKISLSIEGRFLDERAFSLNSQIRF